MIIYIARTAGTALTWLIDSVHTSESILSFNIINLPIQEFALLPANLPAYLHRPAITIILPHFLPNPPDQSHEDVHSIGKFTSLQYDV